MVGEPLGVEASEGDAPGLAVSGRPRLLFSPPLSLRLRRPLLGSELGVARLARGVPELLRRSPRSPAGERAGDAALVDTCIHTLCDLTHSLGFAYTGIAQIGIAQTGIA